MTTTDPTLQLAHTLSIHSRASHDLKITVLQNHPPGLMPINLTDDDGESFVYLRWSEWAEVRDHIDAHNPAYDAPDDSYEVCNAGPGLVPYEALPCILERGHGQVIGSPKDPLGTRHHMDRHGRSW